MLGPAEILQATAKSEPPSKAELDLAACCTPDRPTQPNLLAAMALNSTTTNSTIGSSHARITSRDRPNGLGRADADLGLGLGLDLPGPQFRPLCSGSFCFTAIDPAWGGGHIFFNRRKKDGEWRLVTDNRMIELLKEGVPVTAAAVPADGVGGPFASAALRARDMELDVGVTARALSFLDCISLSRSEAVSKTFRHDISRIAWNDLANQLSREVKDRAKKRWTVQAAGEAIRSKDMVIYAQKEKIASDYVDEVVDMNVYELACKGRILSEVYPKADDYDIFIRFASGDKVLCEGFFDLVDDISILNDRFNSINMDGADLSQWPEMEDFLKCLRLPLTATSEDVIRELFLGMKPWNLRFTVVAIHNRSLQSSIIFSENQHLDCESGERTWDDVSIDIGSDGEIFVDSIIMDMDFSAHHEGEYDLNTCAVKEFRSRDHRKFVQGDLSLRPVVPGRRKKGYGFLRECWLDFAGDTTSKTWEMHFRDEKRTM